MTGRAATGAGGLLARVLSSCLVAILLVAAARSVKVRRDNELNLYIWSNYLAPSTLPGFEARHGVRVNIDYYDANEALLAKLQSGNVGYDVVVPSDYMVEILIREKLLANLDRGLLPHFANLDARFLGLPFDPGNRFSVPYFWGTSGIGYRKDKVDGRPESWDVMWDPRYARRITMLNDVREGFAAALKRLGFSLNTWDLGEIARARELLIEQKKLLKAYNSSNYHEMLLSGDAWLVQGYSGQIARAMADAPNIGYAIPREGCTQYVDNLCIPRQAPHPKLAHLFIDYLLEARVAAEVANVTFYSTPNAAALEFLDPGVRASEAVFPPPERLRKTELIQDVGPVIRIYDAAWTDVKTR